MPGPINSLLAGSILLAAEGYDVRGDFETRKLL
jgi:hypothetical protein